MDNLCDNFILLRNFAILDRRGVAEPIHETSAEEWMDSCSFRIVY